MSSSIKLDMVSFNYPEFSQSGRWTRFPYRSAERSHLALDRVSLDITSGSRLAVVGPNGAGKTTLLRVLAGIFKPTSGRASILGSVSTFLDAGFGLDFQASGRANAKIHALLRGLTGKKCKENVDQICEFTDIGSFIDQPVRTYSQGMISRLVFAVATQWSNDIVIIDEGLAMADSSYQQKAERRLSSWINQANILIFSSHSREVLSKFCNEGIVVRNSRVSEIGSIKETLDQYNL